MAGAVGAAGTAGVDRPALNVRATGRARGVPGRLVVAVQGLDDTRRLSAGFLSSSGHYGVHAQHWRLVNGRRRTVVAHLRAVACAVEYLYRTVTAPGTPVEILVGDVETHGVLLAWARGAGPPGSHDVGSTAAGRLAPLHKTVARDAGTLTFRHVWNGAARDALSEGAGVLATLGLNCSKGLITTRDLTAMTRTHARHDLAAYARKSTPDAASATA
jgi:hypothetical protein